VMITSANDPAITIKARKSESFMGGDGLSVVGLAQIAEQKPQQPVCAVGPR
jgi:hypothetical protein